MVQLEVKMYTIQVDKRIHQISSVLYRLGLWHRGDEATVRETRLKLLYSNYYFLFPISLMAGALTSENMDESIFLVEMVMATTVMAVKLMYLIWRKKEILKLLNIICIYPTENHEQFTLVNDKLKKLSKFTTIFFSFMWFCSALSAIVVPFLGSGNTLFFNIGFPLDWKNNVIAYWIAVAFIFTEVMLSSIAIVFPAIVWYLMFNCALRFEILGHQMKIMGVARKVKETVEERANKRKMSDAEKENLFLQDLISAFESHKYINGLIGQLDSFLSKLFSVQIVTSGICICCSIYFLVFNVSENMMEFVIYIGILLYHIFDIFMVMYFGNEIQLSSDRLSYCLFESDWIDRQQSTKKCVLIFGEFLMKPVQLVVLKLYPLTLETFMRILNSAYRMFNILKNFK